MPTRDTHSWVIDRWDQLVLACCVEGSRGCEIEECMHAFAHASCDIDGAHRWRIVCMHLHMRHVTSTVRTNGRKEIQIRMCLDVLGCVREIEHERREVAEHADGRHTDTTWT